MVTAVTRYNTDTCPASCQRDRQCLLTFLWAVTALKYHQCVPGKGGQQCGNFRLYHGCCPYQIFNKANLRDLIAATGLIILLKLDLNGQFFGPCDLEI